MAKVAREMVEKAGVNVDQLVELLVKNAAAELTTYYYYTILRVNLIGLRNRADHVACFFSWTQRYPHLHLS